MSITLLPSAAHVALSHASTMASETALLSAPLSSHSLLFAQLFLQLHSDTCFVITHRNHHQPKQNQKTSVSHYCQTNDGHHTEMRDHRILEWSRLQRTTMLIQFQPLLCAELPTTKQTRLPRATSSLALNAARDGESTTSLGKLFQCMLKQLNALS